MMILLTIMTMKIGKSLVTANVTSFEPLADWLQNLNDDHIIAVQEHHVGGGEVGRVPGQDC